MGCLCHFQDASTAETTKLLALWEAISERVKAKYIIKVEDDSYVRMDRLVHAISQWEKMEAGKHSTMQDTILRITTIDSCRPPCQADVGMRDDFHGGAPQNNEPVCLIRCG